MKTLPTQFDTDNLGVTVATPTCSSSCCCCCCCVASSLAVATTVGATQGQVDDPRPSAFMRGVVAFFYVVGLIFLALLVGQFTGGLFLTLLLVPLAIYFVLKDKIPKSLGKKAYSVTVIVASLVVAVLFISEISIPIYVILQQIKGADYGIDLGSMFVIYLAMAIGVGISAGSALGALFKKLRKRH